MSLRKLLDENGLDYDVQMHELVYDAQHVAAAEDVTGWDVAKPVIANAEGELLMFVLPAPMDLDLDKAGEVVGSEVRLATEDEFADKFPDCDRGAQPPIGEPYGLKTYLDQSMRERDRLICRDGSHTQTIEVTMDDYLQVVDPEVVDVGTPAD